MGKILTTLVALTLSATVAHAEKFSTENLALKLINSPKTTMAQYQGERSYRQIVDIEAIHPTGDDPFKSSSCEAYFLYGDMKPYLEETGTLSEGDVVSGIIDCRELIGNKKQDYTFMDSVDKHGEIKREYLKGPEKAIDYITEVLAH